MPRLTICVCNNSSYTATAISNYTARDTLHIDGTPDGPVLSVATDGLNDVVVWPSNGTMVAVRILANGSVDPMSNPLPIGKVAAGGF